MKSVAVRDGWYAGTSSECTPLTEQIHILGDVQLVELAIVFLEPILGRLAVRSRGGGVDSDLRHGQFLANKKKVVVLTRGLHVREGAGGCGAP